jgi:hypothetical protein
MAARPLHFEEKAMAMIQPQEQEKIQLELPPADVKAVEEWASKFNVEPGDIIRAAIAALRVFLEAEDHGHRVVVEGDHARTEVSVKP